MSRLTKKLHILKCLSFIITGQTKLHFLTLHILKHFHIKKLNNKAIEFLNIKQNDITKFDIKLHIRFIFLENTIFDSATLSLHILPFFKIGYMPYILLLHVHFVQQKSIGLKFSKSRTGSDIWYSCHHNLRHFTFPIFVHSRRFSVFHSLQSIAPCIY